MLINHRFDYLTFTFECLSTICCHTWWAVQKKEGGSPNFHHKQSPISNQYSTHWWADGMWRSKCVPTVFSIHHGGQYKTHGTNWTSEHRALWPVVPAVFAFPIEQGLRARPYGYWTRVGQINPNFYCYKDWPVKEGVGECVVQNGLFPFKECCQLSEQCGNTCCCVKQDWE